MDNLHDKLWDLMSKHDPAPFGTLRAWCLGGGLPGQLGPHYADLLPPRGWETTFRTFKALKARGIQYIAKPLGMPEALDVRDLFDAARLQGSGPDRVRVPGYPEGYRHTYSREGKAAVSAHMGGERYTTPDGTRGRRGKVEFVATYAKPNAAVLDWWREIMGYDPDKTSGIHSDDWSLSGFELVEREGDGGVLVIARSANGISGRWLALLNSGATLRDLLPPSDLARLDAERAADVAAWGE